MAQIIRSESLLLANAAQESGLWYNRQKLLCTARRFPLRLIAHFAFHSSRQLGRRAAIGSPNFPGRLAGQGANNRLLAPLEGNVLCSQHCSGARLAHSVPGAEYLSDESNYYYYDFPHSFSPARAATGATLRVAVVGYCAATAASL